MVTHGNLSHHRQVLYKFLGYSRLLLYCQDKDSLLSDFDALAHAGWKFLLFGVWFGLLLCSLSYVHFLLWSSLFMTICHASYFSPWPAISTSDVSTGDQFSVTLHPKLLVILAFIDASIKAKTIGNLGRRGVSLNGLSKLRCTICIMTAQEVEALEDSRSTSK